MMLAWLAWLVWLEWLVWYLVWLQVPLLARAWLLAMNVDTCVAVVAGMACVALGLAAGSVVSKGRTAGHDC